jgi:hypothetical protein
MTFLFSWRCSLILATFLSLLCVDGHPECSALLPDVSPLLNF